MESGPQDRTSLLPSLLTMSSLGPFNMLVNEID